MIGINRKLVTMAMVGCLVGNVAAIAGEKDPTTTKIDRYKVTMTADKRAVKDTARVNDEYPTYKTTNNYELFDGTLVEERITATKGTFSENLERMFSALDLSELPSGMLLETGAIFQYEAIQQKSGIAKDRDENNGISIPFSEMYGGLAKSANGNIPSLRKVQRQSQDNFKKHKALPLAISIIDYERVDPDAIKDGRLKIRDGKLHSTSQKPYWESHTFVDAGMVSLDTEVCDFSQMMVMPSDMFLSNIYVEGKPVSFQSATMNFLGSGHSIDVKPDKPFSVPIGALLDGKPELTVGLIVNTNVGSYEILTSFNFQTCLEQYLETVESQQDPWATKVSLIPLDPAPHCDLASTIANETYMNGYGGVIPRVYPASGDTADCEKLNRVMVLLDGIDIFNNRTPDTLWRAFGEHINYFIEQGFDVITLNYEVGNTYVQRNGEAFRTFVVDSIPTMMDSNPDTTDIALLAGSMGGQVANYGLSRAEDAQEEHNTRLFMTLDTEYDGANIPTGLQLAIRFMGETLHTIKTIAGLPSNGDGITNILASPAARQLLRHNLTSTNGVYGQHPLYSELQTEISNLGLPTTSRNVAIANGSGTGHVYAQGLKSKLTYFDYQIPLVLDILLDASTDHGGETFRGKIKVFGVTLKETTVSIQGGMQDDVQPGSSRPTPKDIADPINKVIKKFSPNPNPNLVTYDTPTHSFVPTASALGTGFDFSYYEKCNTGHATITVGNKEVISKEVIALKNGTLPVHNLPFSQACGQPEPSACSQSVFWWDQTFITPTVYGDYCRIADVPAGQAAFLVGQNYYLPKAEPCPYPYTADFNTGKCRITWLPGGILYNSTYNSATAQITMHLQEPQSGMVNESFTSCPLNTNEVSTNIPNGTTAWAPNYHKVCAVNLGWTYSPTDVELIGSSVFLIQDNLCPEGILDVLGCWMGEAPAGVTPVLSGNQFRYSE